MTGSELLTPFNEPLNSILFEVRFTAEVIPYQEHWKRVNKVES